MNRPVWAYLMVAGAILAFSGNAILGRAAPGYAIPPVGLNFWRWLLALIVLLPFGIPDIRRNAAVLRAKWPLFFAYGALGIFAFNTFFYIGLQSTTAIQAALIQSTLPVLVILFAWAIFRQPMTARQAAGACISIPGAVLVVLHGDLGRLGELAFNRGDLWVLAGTSSWAAQLLLLRYIPRGVGFIAFQTVAAAAGVVCTLPFYLNETFAQGRPMPFVTASLGFVAYGGLIGGALGFTLFNGGSLRLNAQTVGYFGNFYPLFTAALAIALLGEHLLWYHLAGGAMVLTGIALATARRRVGAAPEAG
jgi:drug/metabolite transporter (DMT)-like permease